MLQRRDPALIGQEYEIALDEECSVVARVVKSHINDGYSLVLTDQNTNKPMSYEQMCQIALDEIPVIYNENDIYDVVGKLFEAEGKVEADDSITEWDDAVPITKLDQVEQLHQVQKEMLDGIYAESHARVGPGLYLRFGDIIVRCEAKWTD